MENKELDYQRSVVPAGLEGGWYRPLRDKDIKRIHEASLTVLEQTGIEVKHAECREIFRKAGAKIDENRNRVYISRMMVEDALEKAPNEVILYGRDSQHDIVLGGTKVHMGTGGAAINILDLDTQDLRSTTLADIAQIGRLVDALDNIHFYLRPCVAQDISPDLLDINTYYASIISTTKHVTGNCYSQDSVRDVIEMASMIAGDKETLRKRPFISFITSWMISPLRFATESVNILTEIVRQGLPVFLSSAPQAGSTSPAALAGTLVQINAEELSGLTYTQLINPGTPVILGYVPSVADLRTGNFVGGTSEFALMQASAAQLGQFYNLPVYNSSGLTDSKLPDIQAGYEKGISGLAVALSGANYIHHSAGFLESMLTIAYEQYVIDDDINGSIMRMVRGIEITDEMLSVDVIDRVCRNEGHYFTEEQTLNLMRSQYYYPHTADRQLRDNWQAQGATDMRERALQKAREILKHHQPESIHPKIDDAIRKRFEILLPSNLT